MKSLNKYSRGIPLGFKLSYMQDIQLAVEINEYVEFIQAINTIPWKVIFPNKKSPLAHIGGGGISGKHITKYAYGYIKRLRKALPDSKIIGGGGITDIETALSFSEYCDAIAFATLIHNNRPMADNIIERFSN
jgi:dihydroorotate dehydrogenase